MGCKPEGTVFEMKTWVIILMSICSFTAKAANETVIEKLALQVTEEKEQILQNEQQKRNILGELYSMNKNLKKINGERSKIEKNLKLAGENVSSLTQIITQLDEKIKDQRVRLRGRMKVLSKFQGQNVARLLFASHNSGELDASFRTIRIITEKDFRLLKSYQENVRIYRAQKGKLDFQEKKYALLKKSLDQKEKHLASQLDKKNSMIKTIDSSRILHMTELKRLRLKGETSANSELELKKIKAIEDLLKPQMFEQKGALASPVAGQVSQKYGFYNDEDSKTKIRFKGELFQAAKGSPVKSVFDGRVAYAGWLDGYGPTVIVDHGDQYFTVYANSSNLEVDVGDAVKAGTTLGYVSESESFLGKGLYFELRHFSEPEDPSIWIKGS
jgi:septal ring factor EnvC (AmiA/AmiB activator)